MLFLLGQLARLRKRVFVATALQAVAESVARPNPA
jgi:hypothetical protein